jgi:hypothetical protein
MIDINDKVEPKLPDPEFTPEYLEAFLCLCLSKLGGYQVIPLELLKKYPAGGVNLPKWIEEKQSFVMSVAEYATPFIKIARIVPKIKLSKN